MLGAFPSETSSQSRHFELIHSGGFFFPFGRGWGWLKNGYYLCVYIKEFG